jgi:hypothetical protein
MRASLRSTPLTHTQILSPSHRPSMANLPGDPYPGQNRRYAMAYGHH